MSSLLEWLGLTVAFLAPIPAWRDPIREPVRWPLGVWASAALLGLAILMIVPPFAIALDVYATEKAFRAECEASGGRIALTRDARHPYDCERH